MGDDPLTLTLDDFFRGRDESRRIFEALREAVSSIGPAELPPNPSLATNGLSGGRPADRLLEPGARLAGLHITKSQVAFRRRVAFAWAWMPDVYLGGGHAPLVLTLALRRRDPSPRWKQVVEPVPGRFTHHLELYAVDAIDDQVRAWLEAAWRSAE